MTDHEQYEILCVLAATGEISNEEIQDLRRHLAGCPDCRVRLLEYGQMSAQLFPLSGKQQMDVPVPKGMYERFRETARRHGLQIGTPAAFGTSLLSRLGPSAVPLAVIMACLVPVLVMLHLHHHQEIQTVAIKEVVHTATAEDKVTVDSTQRASRTPISPPTLSASNEAVTQRLQEQIARLQNDNKTALAERDQFQSQVDSLKADLASTKQSATQLLQEAETARQQLYGKSQLELQNVAMLAQDHEQIVELQKELSERREDLKRYRTMLSSTDQARDLIVARNLHIIDVHDANGSDDHKLPFGRIFYTEGKSLVFYAYDLAQFETANPQISFHVWGGEQGNENAAKSLGVLRSESSDGRWILTCDDARVLARVNTVFVTAEKGRHTTERPSGKHILYAFLGDQPNHP